MSVMDEQQTPDQEQATEPSMGRPSDYSPELADEICAEVAEGKSMRTICRRDDMPGMATVFRWLRQHADFREQYARAKEDAADAMAEDILEISDDSNEDWETRTNSRTGEEYEVVNPETAARARLRVDSRKWLMAKLQPKKYGDKIDMTSGGEKLGFDVSAEQAAQLIRARADRSDTP